MTDMMAKTALLLAFLLPRSAARRIKRLTAALAVTALGAAGPVASVEAAEVAGAMAGAFGVTPSGAATYNIPIAVPPGTTGVQPSLSLSYSSQAGNGIMGMGWSIGGISFITRCGKDNHFDGYTDPADFDANDQYCLNGERLVPITGAADDSVSGNPGTEYRTHQEEFSKIISYGTIGNGPSWFKVWKKSGEILEYGNGSNSRIYIQGGGNVRAWAIKRILDRRNNYIDYSYTRYTDNGIFRLAEVKYTGNTTTGLAPYNSVKFVYEGRSDDTVAYQAGTKITQDQRLKEVQVRAEGTIIRTYTIAYGAGLSGRSRPTSVTECGLNGECFKPTTFQWSSDGQARFSNIYLDANNGAVGATFEKYNVAASGDFDRDGDTDLYIMRTDEHGRKYSAYPDYILRSRGDGTFYKDWLPDGIRLPDDFSIVATGDFNGDGDGHGRDHRVRYLHHHARLHRP